MKKGLRLIKRLVALSLVLLLSIESFAAVVSDNDGSAFITKGEFDSLKNSFQNQIDQYNTSIDGKIDGAIASYLAGIQVAKTTTKSVLTSNWDYVVDINGTLNNSFDYPSVDANIVLCHQRINGSMDEATFQDSVESTTADVFKILWMEGKISYDKAKPNNKRNLVDNVIIGSTPNLTYMRWAGRANRTKEKWTMSIVKNYSADPGYLENRFDNQFEICQFLNITARNYITSWTNESSPYWVPTVRWQYQRYVGAPLEYVNWGAGTTYAVSTIPTIDYLPDDEDNTYSYEHIISHKAASNFEVCAKSVTNYLTTSSNNTLRTNGWVSASSKSGVWTGTEVEKKSTAGVNHTTNWSNRCTGMRMGAATKWTDNTSTAATNKAEIPVLGLLGSYAASSIYQYKKDDIIDDDGNKLDAYKLHQGLPAMKVSADEMVEWEPVFKDIKVTGKTGIDECKIILSYVPFTDKGTSTDYVKMDGISLGSWATTVDKKVKIKFEAGKDSVIFAKWVPNTDSTTIDGDTYWEATLDLTQCNTYRSTKE